LEEAIRDPRTVVIQLRDRIADLIRKDGLKPGDQLPTEAELTQRYKISRPALREALKLLEQDDIIFVKHGRGRFVSSLAAVTVERPITVFESVTDMTHHFGYRTRTEVLSVAEELPDPETTEQLACAPGDYVIRLERLRFQDAEPIMYCVDYVPRHIIPGPLSDAEWSGSLLALLEKHRHRPRMSAARVSAVTLPQDVIEKSDLASFGPALLIRETCFSPLGIPVIYAVDYHKGSHFTFSFART
jgi:GntR family transcriptional regulator